METKTVSYVQGIALFLGAVLGSGILILPGFAAEVAGPASILAWVVLSMVSIALAYSFTRLALRYQDLGGIATIVRHAFGTEWGALAGWWYFYMVSIGEAVVALTGAGYLVSVFAWSDIALYVVAVMFLLAGLISNLLGMRHSGRLSLILSGLVLAILIATIATALPGITAQEFLPFVPRGLNGVGKACLLLFWSFLGWESIAHLVPEFRYPERDVMRSMWTSIIIIGLVYTLLAVVTVGTHTYGSAGSQAPLAVLMHHSLGMNAGLATAVVVCIVCAGTINVYFATTSRLGYAMARDKNFPSWFGILNKRGAPSRSVWFLFITNTAAVLVSYLFTITIDKIILIPTMLGICSYIILSLASVKLLWKDRKGRISSIIAAVCCAAVIPFAPGFLLVPLLVAGGYFVWLIIKHRVPIFYRYKQRSKGL